MEKDFLSKIKKMYADDFLSTDLQDLEHFGTDWTKVYPPRPSAIVFPRSTEEVSSFLKFCSEHKVAVVPSGGRTGLSGGAVASKGEIILSLTKMNKMGKIDALSLTLPVQAGAITEAVHHHCEPHGLTWPVDFGSKGSSCVGGNISTNAGGINVIKYGMTRHWVLGLTVVLMSGEILELNGSLEKNNTGLDLKHLFIGSEGIFGVITEAILKLVRVEENTKLFFFGTKGHAQVFKLLEAARRGSFDIYAFEVFSKNCFESTTTLHKIRSPFSQAHEQYVLLKIKGDTIDSWLEEVFEKEFVSEGVQAKSEEEARLFWKTRETISESLRTRGQLHTSDISVPISEMKTFLERWETIFKEKYSDWELFVFGHFGDGNLHIHAVRPEVMTGGDFLEKNHQVERDLFALVKEHRGSISAEHGIGLLKKENLHFSKSAKEIALLRAFKNIFDPQGLLNPGKVIDF